MVEASEKLNLVLGALTGIKSASSGTGRAHSPFRASATLLAVAALLAVSWLATNCVKQALKGKREQEHERQPSQEIIAVSRYAFHLHELIDSIAQICTWRPELSFPVPQFQRSV
jgi:hypothetical protein